MVSWSKRAVRDSGSGSSDFSLAHFLNSISGRSDNWLFEGLRKKGLCINQFKILKHIIDTVISKIYIRAILRTSYCCYFIIIIIIIYIIIIIIVEPKHS